MPSSTLELWPSAALMRADLRQQHFSLARFPPVFIRIVVGLNEVTQCA